MIYIKQLNNAEKESIKVERNCLIKYLKVHIYDRILNIKIPPEKQELIHLDTKLREDETLSDCKITNGSSIILFEKSIKLMVKILGELDYRIYLECGPYTKIKSLCEQIEEKSKIPSSKQILYLSNKRLQNSETVDHYGLNEDSKILLIRKEICINFLDHPPLFCDVDLNYRVDYLKAIIKRQTGIKNRLTLQYKNKELDDTRRLADYGIIYGSTVDMLWQLKTGH